MDEAMCDLWITGDAAPELHVVEQAGTVLSGQELLSSAERMTQVINGEFVGTRPSEELDTLRIHAVDSSFWEVFGDEGCLNRVRSAFSGVRPSRCQL